VTERLRLADLLASLSIVADMGYALPPEQALRSCVLATALARRIGLPDTDVADTFYTALLVHVGCVTFAHEMASAFGDDRSANLAGAQTNFADPRDIFRTLIPQTTRGKGVASRAKDAAVIVTQGRTLGKRYDVTVCEVGRETARRVGLDVSVQRALYQIKEWWNGKGGPQGLRGEEIAMPARIARTASEAALFHRLGDEGRSVEAIRRRAGKILDPSIVDVFVGHASALFEEMADDPRVRVLDVEPEPVEIGRTQLRDVAAAFGDLADLKTPFTAGHSREVARLVELASDRAGLDATATQQTCIAALLHDLGRVGISNAIWEKPGTFTAAEWEHVRMHAYHSERILATSQSLEPMARLVGMHHERLDGSGYHRGCRASEISMPARLLAAADVFQAMTEHRPHRPARTREVAAAELMSEVQAGRLDADAVAAVVEAAGEPAPARSRRAAPAGLSEREVEVLRLVAEGCSNPQIAKRLHISRRTAEHHVQHVYTKIGVSSRAAAALFALDNELLRPTDA
jgi:HD-GYP domain-containing protein (c-di-GMP phosphodiesterase class II)